MWLYVEPLSGMYTHAWHTKETHPNPPCEGGDLRHREPYPLPLGRVGVGPQLIRTMAVNYAVMKTRNPKGIEGTDYFHGRAVKTSDYDFEDLAGDVQMSTTMTEADVLGVLRAMKGYIVKALLAGRVVVLNDIGRFQIGIKGKCYSRDAMSAEDFSPASKITGHRIVFRPEAKLKSAIAGGLTLKRVSSEALA